MSCHTANSKPVKQEVNGTVILPPSVFPAWANKTFITVQASLAIVTYDPQNIFT